LRIDIVGYSEIPKIHKCAFVLEKDKGINYENKLYIN